MSTKNLIIGAWPSGITLAQRLAEKWERVQIIEKRSHIGGNCYDYLDEHGILIHQYGPHIFHTNHEEVWNYLSRFTEFTNFEHKVLGSVDGKLIPIPFNLNSLSISFSEEQAKSIEESLLKYYEYGSKVSIVDLRKKAKEENDANLSFIADYIYEKVFKNYTIKQWGITAEEINEDVLKRVPVVIGHDDRYFPHNKFQWMPRVWYTKMFEWMLDSENIHITLDTDYKDVLSHMTYDRLFFTWPIDEYFGYKYGKLEYRKTLYQLETYDQFSYQENIVINYPNEHEYTRITEYKKFYPDLPNFNQDKTVICKEIPGIWDVEAYPVESAENLAILEKYREEANQLENVYFLWRLANFKYLDMDNTVKMALDFKI
jgi:UDP-galactopyranose mutase